MPKDRRLGLVSSEHPKSAMAEAFRTLRTNLGFASIDSACRSVLVTACGPGDGKTITSANLAVVLAQAGKNTILVDCDLRRPAVHTVFGVGNLRGLTNCLLQDIPVEEVAYTTLVPNLTIVTSGPIPPNPVEVLASEKVHRLWEDLKARYDYVVIDSPPILMVTDAAVLSASADGVLLVIASGSTRIDAAAEAKAILERANARILGVVLNKVKREGKHYYYKYYNYSYGYGGEQ